MESIHISSNVTINNDPFAFIGNLPQEIPSVVENVHPEETKKKGRPICTKSKEEQKYVVAQVKRLIESGVSQQAIADAAKVNSAQLTRAKKGQKLSDDVIEALYQSGHIERPTASELRAHAEANNAAPKENWHGELKSTKEASSEKGVGAATIRNYAKNGKLDYVRIGKRIYICVNEKYADLKAREIVELRKKVLQLESENARLRKQVESLQLFFDFDKSVQPEAQSSYAGL